MPSRSPHHGGGGSQLGQTWPQPSMYVDSPRVVRAPQPGFAQVMVSEGEVVTSMGCSLREWSPAAGSWFVVCSDAGGHAGAIGREGNRPTRVGEVVFSGKSKTAPAQPAGGPRPGKRP